MSDAHAQALKDRIGVILLSAAQGRDPQYTYQGYIRWGRVQDDINRAIDACMVDDGVLTAAIAKARAGAARLGRTIAQWERLYRKRYGLGNPNANAKIRIHNNAGF